ncbi:GFA family protein [Aquibium sp. ELW1220]|uniref:GFA family protein n=1 Tax=Aquibium sp. ELW1220 TaxID=2976766 RepID=UPI0025AF92F2|nr:GFA family protein [Aquibium sp. ELW1220]MDN2578456.1 GFA family protein [Aquibium sp. ELW1220]
MQAKPTTSVSHTGGCRCGAVRFEAVVEPHHISYCHCANCRRATGAPVSAFVGFAAGDVRFTAGEPRLFENGPASRSFCATCGSPIAYTDARLENQIWFMLGAMDSPKDYKPTLHAYVREQLRYVHMPDDLPQLERSSVPRSGTSE